jgi:hypothetical protein
MNIKSISPTWLRNWRLPSDSFGNNSVEKEGKYIPNKEGPKTIPATISPITVGWPSQRHIHPNTRATTIIVMICASRIARG